MDQPYDSLDATCEAYAAHVAPGKVALYRQLGIAGVMGRREGAAFEDAFTGEWVFNCHCNGGVFNLGHRHPRVVQALREALDSLDIGNHHLISGMRAGLAERLAATTGGALPGVAFAASGGEAIDLAIKTVRGATRRSTIVSAEGSYHGPTGLALAAGDPYYRDPFGDPPPGFVHVPYGDLEALEASVDGDTAAVLLEAIPATLGMRPPSEDYFPGVAEVCSRNGTKLILDEVQTGLGRTGRIWCFQRYGIRPDVLVTGKGLSGGMYPMAAALMTGELLHFYDDFPLVHFSTYGGAELGCVAALAVLDIIEEPGFLEHVDHLGERFAAGFAGLPFVLHQTGMMMGLEFEGEGAGVAAMGRFLEAGLLAVYANNATSCLQFLPPLILTDAEADEIIGRVRGIFA